MNAIAKPLDSQCVVQFRFESSDVRAILIGDQPWFVAADVCKALGVSNTTQALQSLDEDERSMFNIGRAGKVNIISESGLYVLILRSRDAVSSGTAQHRFRKWVTSEVLPAIRRHGVYQDVNNQASMLIGQTIGTDGFHCLAAVLDGKLRHLPMADRRRAKQHVWAQVHKAFSVVSTEDIPAGKMPEVRNFIAAYAIEGEYLPSSHRGVVLTATESRNLLSTLKVAAYVVSAWKRFAPALRLLDSKLAPEAHDCHSELKLCLTALQPVMDRCDRHRLGT